MTADVYAELLALVLVVVVFLRLVPGTMWKTRGFDMGAHLLYRKAIRRNKLRMPPRVELLTLDRCQTYPWLYHQLIALLPERLLTRLPALPSAAFDAASAAAVFALTAHLAAAVKTPDEAGAATIAGILFATSPSLLAHGIGPRAYELTPRPLGELLFTVTLLLFAYGSIENAPWALILATASTAFSCLASRFSLQAMVFVFPMVAVATGRYALLIVLVAGVAGAVALSLGRYWRILAAHPRYLLLYRRRLQYDHPSLISRNDWRQLVGATHVMLRSRFRSSSAARAFASSIENNTYIQFMLRNVVWWLVLALWAAGGYPRLFGAADWRNYLLAAAAAPVLPAFATSLRKWRFLGEAERYPEYGIAPACILAGLAFSSTPWLASVAFIVSAPALAYTWWRRSYASRRAWVRALDEAALAIQQLPENATVLAIPANLSPTLAYGADRRFAAALDTIRWAEDYERIFDRYPWPSSDLAWWRETHGVDHIVVMRWFLSPEAGCTTTYNLDGLPVLFDNGEFVVYALRPVSLDGIGVRTPTDSARTDSSPRFRAQHLERAD